MATPTEYGSVILSVNRGLWGEVPASLRSVQITYDDSEIHLYCYFSGVVSDDDEDSMHVVGTSVAADFPQHDVFEHCVALPPPSPLPRVQGRHIVFLRKESPS